MPNWYVSRNALKTQLDITDTVDDSALDSVIEQVSRLIDQEMGRWFYPQTQTRYYTAQNGNRLLVDDLLSVTSLKTDEDGDRTYETTWAATDYDLTPDNAASGSPPEPYWAIETTPDGNETFPTIRRGVQIVGSWGYYDQRTTSSATLNEALDASETGVDVTSGAAFEVGQTILIGSEQMFISAIASNTLTVTRGVNGTTAATHDSGAAIQVYSYPVITELCRLLTARMWARKKSALGISGSDATGFIRISRNDPDYERFRVFRRERVG